MQRRLRLRASQVHGRTWRSGISDATLELMARIRCIFDKAGVIWQTGPAGSDQGGGGTVAMCPQIITVDTVDAGVRVLSIRAVQGCVAKLDLWHTRALVRSYRD